MTRIKKFLVAATLIAAAMLTAFSLGGGVLLWAVSGLLMVTAMVVLTAGEIAKQPSEKGITLQTLIVTAVLVLMAGAAGVVIIAITNNSADNLEGQNSGLDSRCQPWEIFDPTLDAAGRGGGQGGVGSSASGCVRVCYIGHKDPTTKINKIASEDASNAAAVDGDDIGGKLELLMSRSDIASSTNPATSGKTMLVVSGNDKLSARNTLKEGPTTVALIDLDINTSAPATATKSKYDPANMSIEVAPNGRYCQVWNNTDDEMVLRSEN